MNEYIQKCQEEEIKNTLGIGRNNAEVTTNTEDLMEIIIDMETDEEKEIKRLKQELKEANLKIENLKKEVEKYESIEKTICSKEVSIFHCENCKEVGTDYEYCPQSSINLYKTLFLAEEKLRMEKEKDLDEFNNLFATYTTLEDKRTEEQLIKEQETFDQILAELDIKYNSEMVEMNEK